MLMINFNFIKTPCRPNKIGCRLHLACVRCEMWGIRGVRLVWKIYPSSATSQLCNPGLVTLPLWSIGLVKGLSMRLWRWGYTHLRFDVLEFSHAPPIAVCCISDEKVKDDKNINDPWKYIGFWGREKRKTGGLRLDVSLAGQGDQLLCIPESLITTTTLSRANADSGLGARLENQAAGGLIPVLPWCDLEQRDLSVHQSFRILSCVMVPPEPDGACCSWGPCWEDEDNTYEG